MLRFLLDANVSPEIALLFRELGYGAKSIQEECLGRLSDEEIIALAKREKRIIMTFDHDFAETWYFKERGKIGVLYLRTHFQTTEYVKGLLRSFIRSKILEKENLGKALVVLSEGGHRIVRY